jgi:mRNA interferase RelE/StbE
MEKCQIEFRRSAEKDLERIDQQLLSRIFAAINELAEDPFPSGFRKLVGGDQIYRIRVGDYRVIYRFTAENRLITIERVRHRREVYR